MVDEASIEVIDDGKSVTVVGCGELNLRIAPDLGGALKQAVATGKDVVLDLRPAHYIDSAIIWNVIDASRAMSITGRRLKVLVSPEGHPQYVLEIAGIDALVDMIEDDSQP